MLLMGQQSDVPKLFHRFSITDDYVPTVEVGDIPIHIDGIKYFYRPSDGSVVLG